MYRKRAIFFPIPRFSRRVTQKKNNNVSTIEPVKEEEKKNCNLYPGTHDKGRLIHWAVWQGKKRYTLHILYREERKSKLNANVMRASRGWVQKSRKKRRISARQKRKGVFIDQKKIYQFVYRWLRYIQVTYIYNIIKAWLNHPYKVYTQDSWGYRKKKYASL